MDVTSLYNNIPHADGMRACKDAWEEMSVKDPPTETLVKLLAFVLKCNNFEFKEKHYLQVQGTAMDTKMASAYANIFMGRLEEQFLKSVSLKPFSGFRFIDDVSMLLTHGHENLKISSKKQITSTLPLKSMCFLTKASLVGMWTCILKSR